MYVCICHDVKSKQVKKAIKAGHDTMDALKDELSVATCCGCCEPMVQDFLDEHHASLDMLAMEV